MALFNEQKPSKLESIFKGNVPIDKIANEGKKYIFDNTGEENTDPIDSIFAGFVKADQDDQIGIFRKSSRAGKALFSAQQFGQEVRSRTSPIVSSILDRGKQLANKMFEIMNPGQTYVQPALEKRGASPLFAGAIGLGLDLIIPGPGELTRIGNLLEKSANKMAKETIFRQGFDQAQYMQDLAKRLKTGKIETIDKYDLNFLKTQGINLQINKQQKLFKGLPNLSTKLLNEARKYKTAEEFVNSQLGKASEITKPIENRMLGRFWVDEKTGKESITSMGRDNNLRAWKQTPERSFEITPQIAEDFNKSFGKIYGEITPGQKAYSYKSDLLIEPSVSKRPEMVNPPGGGGNYVPSEETLKLAIDVNRMEKGLPPLYNAKTKSQLTDIWKRANVGIKKKPIEKLFKGLPNLSTKLLEEFKGLPEKIKSGRFEEIINLAKKKGIKQVDEDIVRSSIVKNGDIIDLPKTAARVEERLVPLTATPVKSPRWSYIGEDFIGDGKYGEIVYESPIKTSAGDVHFQNPRANYYGEGKGFASTQSFPNYFSHIRYEDMADGKMRKIIETQSDLFQKNRIDLGAVDKVDYQKLQPYNSNDPLAHLRTFREEVKRAAQDGKNTLLIPSGETAMKIEGLGETSRFYDAGEVYREYRRAGFEDFRGAIEEGMIEHISDFSKLKIGKEIISGNGDNWIITDILGDGKFKAVPKQYERYFTKSQTAYKSSSAEWKNQQMLDSVSETFDISGKVDTKHFVYKLNEEAMPREARKMGLNVEGKIKKDNGEWWKIKIGKEMKNIPVSAFGYISPKAVLATTGGILAGGVGLGIISSEERKNRLENAKKLTPNDIYDTDDIRILEYMMQDVKSLGKNIKNDTEQRNYDRLWDAISFQYSKLTSENKSKRIFK